MSLRKLTIVLLPEGARKTRQLKIPQALLYCFFLISLVGILSLVWSFREYQEIKTQVPRLALLKKENKLQKLQLANLAHKVDLINGKLVELQKFDRKLRVMVNLEISEDNSQFLGIGGSDPTVLNPDYTIEKAHQKLIRLLHQSLDNLNTEITVQKLEKAELYQFLGNQKSMLASTPSIWPVKGWVSSGFGNRTSPFTNEKEFHKGLDISAKMNTPVIAPADGVVSAVGKTYGYGKNLHIKHGHGIKTSYGHLQKSLVKKGQYVKRGQIIALVGNSGRSTGPHLHYEVYLKGIPLNPLRYILN